MQRLFVVQKLVLTMKGLKETLTLPWTRRIEAFCFFMPFVLFMVNSLVWWLPMSFMVRSV